MEEQSFEFPEFAYSSMPERMRGLRLHHGYSRAQMAAATNGAVSANTIETFEKERSKLNTEQLMAICDVLKVSPNYLLTGRSQYDPDSNDDDKGPVSFRFLMVWGLLFSQLPLETRRVLESLAYDSAIRRIPKKDVPLFRAYLRYFSGSGDLDDIDPDDPESLARALEKMGSDLEGLKPDGGPEDKD